MSFLTSGGEKVMVGPRRPGFADGMRTAGITGRK